MSTFKQSTNALHAGYDPQAHQGAQAVPIYQTSSYVFENADDAAGRFNLSVPGYIYTRLNNPTNDVLEQRLAAVEGGVGAVVTSSGAAALTTTFLTLLRTGEHIVSSNSLYGGTYNLLNVAHFDQAVQDNTRAIFIETLGNPKLDVLDIEAIAKVAQKHKIPLIVDNTVATPVLLNPIKYGANIVVHSLTKYIGGNGTSLGGAIIDGGNFDWSSGKFPEFTEPSAGYHGLVLHEALGNLAFIAKVRIEGLRDLGTSLSPFNAFQILQSLETLPVRVKKHSENALALAQWLKAQPEVAWVNYPGLEDSPYKSLADKYLQGGQSGLVTFGLKGGFESAKKTVNNVKIFSLLANLGDTKSLIIHPASTTHQQLSEEAQVLTGVTPDLIRLSVGLEDIEDLQNDLKQAFK